MDIKNVFNIFQGGSVSIPWDSVLTILGYIVGFIVMGAFLFIGVFILRKFFQYDSDGIVFIKKGSNIIDVKKDKVREIYDEQGKPVLQFLRMRKGYERLQTPKPENKYCYKKGKKTVYFLWQDDNNQMHPIKVGFKEKLKSLKSKELREEIKQRKVEASKGYDTSLKPMDLTRPEQELLGYLQPIPHERLAWARLEDKRQAEKLMKRDRFKELLVQAAPIVMWISMLFIAFFMWKYIGEGLMKIASAVNELIVRIG